MGPEVRVVLFVPYEIAENKTGNQEYRQKCCQNVPYRWPVSRMSLCRLRNMDCDRVRPGNDYRVGDRTVAADSAHGLLHYCVAAPEDAYGVGDVNAVADSG